LGLKKIKAKTDITFQNVT